MRKYLIFICTVLLASCLNNDFLERYPLGDPTAETAFETYDNFKRSEEHTSSSSHANETRMPSSA